MSASKLFKELGFTNELKSNNYLIYENELTNELIKFDLFTGDFILYIKCKETPKDNIIMVSISEAYFKAINKQIEELKEGK